MAVSSPFAMLLIPLALLTIALGCAAPTPTPAPTPTATATPTPIPTSTPTATPPATFTPTPPTSPTPTPTPTATPLPTATPTATATPAPTATPSLAEVLPKLRASVVKVTSGAVQVSGVVLANPANHVLTTSVSLGAGPLVSVQAENGQTFVGWIVGRDDAKNLALVKVKDANFPGVPFGDSLSVKVGGEVLLISYPVARPEGFAASATITGVRTDFSTGARFIRLDIPALLGASGGPVFNRAGELLAIIVEPSYIVSIGFAATEEADTRAEDSIRPAISALVGGAVNLTAPRPTPTPNPASPPPLPVIVKGKATAGGLPAPTGLTLYARLFGPGLLEQWYFVTIGAEGAYDLTIGVNNPVYTSGKIEFYLDGVKSGVTINYQAGEVVGMDLSFP